MLTASALFVLYFLDWNALRGAVSHYVSHRLGREVRIEGNLAVDLFSITPSLTAEHVTIANPGWTKEPLAADIGRFAASIRLMPWLRGETILPNVEFDDPDILVIRDASGRTNWDLGLSGQGAKLPAIRRFVVKNGHLRIDDRVRKVLFVGVVSSNEQAGAGDRAFQLTGDGTLNANKFLADVHGGPLVNVDTSKPYRFSADIRSGATHIVADGTFPHPFHLGQFTAATSFSGPTMSDLYYLTGLAFPPTPPYRLDSMLTRDGASWRFDNMRGVVGESDLQGQMSVDAARMPVFLQARLASKRLRLVDLGPFIGAPPASATAPVRKTVLALPDTPLAVDRVRRMNADVQYDAASVASRDFPLRDFHLHLLLEDGVMTLDPITFDFAHGKLGGAVKVDARKAVPVSDVDARLTDIRLEQFVKGSPPPVEGLLAARAKLHAAGASIHAAAENADGAVTFVVPSGKMRKSLAELTGIDALNAMGLALSGDKSDASLRCALLRFDAHDGTLTARQFTIDTEDVLIEGQGTVNLKDEALDMQIAGHPKALRIGRIRAPIVIGGTLSDPAMGVKASGALGQGGIAAALGFLNPIAAVLAFVDPGLAKDANCAKLTQSAVKGPAPVKSRALKAKR